MENKGESVVCPHCGYSENGPRIQSFLPPRSLIGNRYLVGKVLSYNGEGVTYIGFDTVSDRKVSVREFFPDALVTRAEDGCSVEVRPNCQIQFKTYLSDFLEVNEKIAHLRSISCLVQILDIVRDCGTVYAISEHLLGETLEQFLQRRGVMLTWGETYDLLMPIIRTMQLIHEDGIIHRGISPSTIYITPSGKAKLAGFGISAVRAARTELAAELFPGFSAPEQYSSTSPHGTWTDIYAICAVLYFCVTGIAPPEALIRSPENELIRPRERNETVPTRVSNAIMQGLALRPDDRIHTIQELTPRLVVNKAPSGSDAPTVAIPAIPTPPRRTADDQPRYPENSRKPSGSEPKRTAEPQRPNLRSTVPKNSARPNQAPRTQQRPVQKQQTPPRKKQEEEKSGRSIMMTTMLITLPILLLILIFTFWFLFGNRSKTESYKNNIVSSDSSASEEVSSSGFGNYTPPVTSSEEESSEESSEPEEEPSSEESSTPTWSMVNLVGRQLEEVQHDGEVTGHVTLSDIEYVYSESSPEGEIIWQDVSTGTSVENGAAVRIKVSRGSQYVTFPDWEKQTESEYCSQLDALGIPYKVDYRSSNDYPSGYVIGSDHMVDTKYDRSSQTVVTVYVCENSQSYGTDSSEGDGN
jgi:serine/threonine-protein kinase